jgi:hypothetical protein
VNSRITPQNRPSENVARTLLAPQKELTSNPFIVVPTIAVALSVYAVAFSTPSSSGWMMSSWPLLAVSLALALVSVARRRYDGWHIVGDRVEVARDNVIRTYRAKDVESVSCRNFFNGFASVTDASGIPEQGACRWVHTEVTVTMKNGDQTAAVLSPSAPALSLIQGWAPPPPRQPLAFLRRAGGSGAAFGVRRDQ